MPNPGYSASTGLPITNGSGQPAELCTCCAEKCCCYHCCGDTPETFLGEVYDLGKWCEWFNRVGNKLNFQFTYGSTGVNGFIQYDAQLIGADTLSETLIGGCGYGQFPGGAYDIHDIFFGPTCGWGKGSIASPIQFRNRRYSYATGRYSEWEYVDVVFEMGVAVGDFYDINKPIPEAGETREKAISLVCLFHPVTAGKYATSEQGAVVFRAYDKQCPMTCTTLRNFSRTVWNSTEPPPPTSGRITGSSTATCTRSNCDGDCIGEPEGPDGCATEITSCYPNPYALNLYVIGTTDSGFSDWDDIEPATYTTGGPGAWQVTFGVAHAFLFQCSGTNWSMHWNTSQGTIDATFPSDGAGCPILHRVNSGNADNWDVGTSGITYFDMNLLWLP